MIDSTCDVSDVEARYCSRRTGRGLRCNAAVPAALQPWPETDLCDADELKPLLREAGERTREGLWNRIGSLLDHFPPHQCSNYFKHAGYAMV